MFKQASFIGLFWIACSCGHGKEAAPPEVNDSTSSSSKPQITGKEEQTNITPQHEAYNKDIKNLSTSLVQFIPEDYTAIDTVSGNLNLDSFTDMIMVLKKNGEETTSDVVNHPEKRPLLILIGQADNTYKLAARNDNAVYCIDCGGMMGDPFMNVVIKNGYFSVEHYGGSAWRWTRTITFKYSASENNWFLHKDGGDSFHASEPEKVTTEIKTTKDFGKIPFDKFDIYKEN